LSIYYFFCAPKLGRSSTLTPSSPASRSAFAALLLAFAALSLARADSAFCVMPSDVSTANKKNPIVDSTARPLIKIRQPLSFFSFGKSSFSRYTPYQTITFATTSNAPSTNLVIARSTNQPQSAMLTSQSTAQTASFDLSKPADNAVDSFMITVYLICAAGNAAVCFYLFCFWRGRDQ
jgi:hypothetical protein